ncbi:uncharacterized protein C4orf36 homolog [Anolis carolinensis]|uniref:uncharacterized protein C4orf36 homolog n=1 Tax=Anolis carolinensis TaxID=28377 RepID=UPI0004628E91|nr:PREDICTED: uncharacterized protein C4orf36 homolog [Anolis carolinensis]|eukprot:XP_008109225.1 PREDICTED: uncharacterized protein C4orf36 homolog [Anolis carolinensis]
MEYNLYRKKKITTVFKDSPYKLHDRLAFAALTRRLLFATEEPIANPLHFEICWGSPFKLRPVTTVLKTHFPSMQMIQEAKLLEIQRLENIQRRKKLAKQVESEFRCRLLLERRPLPPSGPN